MIQYKVDPNYEQYIDDINASLAEDYDDFAGE